jgi:hypothetical protein
MPVIEAELKPTRSIAPSDMADVGDLSDDGCLARLSR